MRKRAHGFTMLEMVVVLAVAGLFLFVLIASQREALSFERKNRIDLFTMPDKSIVLARVRHDILDGRSFPATLGPYKQGEQMLIAMMVNHDTKVQTAVVYDFTKSNRVERIEFDGDGNELSRWSTDGTPQFQLTNTSVAGRDAFRLRAMDNHGQLVVDQIIAPRASGS